MPDVRDTVEEIVLWHRQRCFFMEQRKRGHLSLASWLRTSLGWSPVLLEKERARIRKQALDLIRLGRDNTKAVEKGRSFECDEPDYLRFQDFILSALVGDAYAERSEKIAEKEMARLAQTLPVWGWVRTIPGLGPLGLAIIVGEAGNLSDYPDKGRPARRGPDCLYKRMGVALIGGVRQGGLPKGASKEEWIAHGYSRRRRSRLYTIGDALIKKPGPYRELYLERKEVEREKLPDATPLYIHRRAQRYMEKRLLKDLWRAWRRASPLLPKGAAFEVPAADQNAA